MARSLRALQVLIICSVSILSPPLLAMADSVSYQGIALPVTSLGKLGHGQVAVSVFNQAALVSESQVGRRVVLLYTSSGRLHDLSLQSIGELLVAASADGDGQLTVALLTALLRDPKNSAADDGDRARKTLVSRGSARGGPAECNRSGLPNYFPAKRSGAREPGVTRERAIRPPGAMSIVWI